MRCDRADEGVKNERDEYLIVCQPGADVRPPSLVHSSFPWQSVSGVMYCVCIYMYALISAATVSTQQAAAQSKSPGRKSRIQVETHVFEFAAPYAVDSAPFCR